MGDLTVINPSIRPTPATVVNDALAGGPVARSDASGAGVRTLAEGTLIADRYRVVDRLDVPSGEADLYRCSDGSQEFVLKLYKRRNAIKPSVAETLLHIDSPYVARLYEVGEFEELPYEILPYFGNGSLQGHTFIYEELLGSVIPSINEGIHALHRANIIHKDLKPSNIMIGDDGETLSIIDFGVSSLIEDESQFLITKTGMTPEYSAPETLQQIFLEESDYYSFGITLYELFCGHTPYANMTAEDIGRYSVVQRLPFPKDMPQDLRDLISALTYLDISHRQEKDNPNHRWTYEDVVHWLDDDLRDTLMVPGEGMASGEAMPPYRFHGREFTELRPFVEALSEHWTEGRRELFTGNLGHYFESWHKGLAMRCRDAEEQARRLGTRDDYVYWRLLYQLDPELRRFQWRGHAFESLTAFGRNVLETLWSGDRSANELYGQILSERLLSEFVSLRYPRDGALRKQVEALERSFELDVVNGYDHLRTFYLMGYALSGQQALVIDGREFHTLGEFGEFIRDASRQPFEHFKALCHSLVDENGQLNGQLDAWLMMMGKEGVLESWRNAMDE